MSDYVLRGTKKLLDYHTSLNVPIGPARMAAALGLPRILFAGNGREDTSYISPVYAEWRAQALARLLGVSVANVTTNGGQEVVG